MVPHAVHLVECPRDAMQGLHHTVPTDVKVAYLNALLRVGFPTLDFGSFVSPKAIPQLADTQQVLDRLDLDGSASQLLAIIANERGAQQALANPQIAFLGFPFSLSEQFQQRNTNKTRQQAFDELRAIHEACEAHSRTLVVYLSMGFGNPYGEEWSPQLLLDWAGHMADHGIRIVSLADTIGAANPTDVDVAFRTLIPAFPDVHFGAHFHATPTNWREKIDAAYQAGCRRFDGALGGFGGCPFADDHLTGNVSTENLLSYFAEKGTAPELNRDAWFRAHELLPSVFNPPA